MNFEIKQLFFFFVCCELSHIIANIEDTNMYHRAGTEATKHAVETIKNLLKAYPEPTKEQIELLDDQFIKHNLSPDGCADLLTITYFLYSLKR